jgi:hypothetical protein
VALSHPRRQATILSALTLIATGAGHYLNPAWAERAWGAFIASVVILVPSVLMRFLRKKVAAQAVTVETTASASQPSADLPHEKIGFDYLPASPLQNGWHIGYFDKRINPDDRAAVAEYLKSRRWAIAPDSPTEGSIMIDIDNCGMDRSVSPNAALSKRIEFEANYIDTSAMIFVEVLLATRDNETITPKFVKFILGRKKPYRTLGYENSEYTVEIDPPSLGRGWRKIILSLPDEIERSWGRDGWYYQGLRTIRLRGKLGISPLRLY